MLSELIERQKQSENPREASRAMGSDGLVTGVAALAKHMDMRCPRRVPTLVVIARPSYAG